MPAGRGQIIMTPRVAKKDERGIFRDKLARYASELLAADHWDETNPIAPTEFRSWDEAAVLSVGPLVRSWRLSRRAVHTVACVLELRAVHHPSREPKGGDRRDHPHSTEQWMKQMARNVTMEGCGALGNIRYLLHDRDTKYTASFLAIIESVHVKTLPLPARSPNLNAYSERCVRSAKEECLSKLVLFGERSLRRAIRVRIITLSKIIRGSLTSCCFPKSRKLVVTL
jgi:hypothetical protein